MGVERSIVAILGSAGDPVGAGCLITAGFVATCAHVVARALDLADVPAEMPDRPVQVRFPFVPDEPEERSDVILWWPHPERGREGRDLAILRLAGTPAQARTGPLARPGVSLHRADCQVYGFPRAPGHWIDGRVKNRRSDGWLQIAGEDDFTYFIEPGFSGAPVTLSHDGIEAVVGLISVREPNPDLREAFAIPAEHLEEALKACTAISDQVELELLKRAVQDLATWFGDHRPNDPQFIRAAECSFRNLGRTLDEVEKGRTGEAIAMLVRKRDALGQLESEAREHQHRWCFEDRAVERLFEKLQAVAGDMVPGADPSGRLVPSDYRDDPAHWSKIEELLEEIEALNSRLDRGEHALNDRDVVRLRDVLGDLEAELLRKKVDLDRLVAVRKRLDQIKAAFDLLQRVILLHEVFLGCHVRLLPSLAVFRDWEDTPPLVVIPVGSFVMGSPKDEPERSDSEGPQHRVDFARRFALGQFPLTFEEYERFAEAIGRKPPGDEGWGRGRRPVINVSWDEAKAYVAWLGEVTGRPYRLPSEAEWEYCCRAETPTPFWTGATISTDQANYNGHTTYGGGRKGEYRGRTTPVDAFAPNDWGLHDMHGNVWEWVEDCWNPSYAGAPTDGSAWTSGDCNRRVLRGGSWNGAPRLLRSACRNRGDAGSRGSYTGFRVARTLTP